MSGSANYLFQSLRLYISRLKRWGIWQQEIILKAVNGEPYEKKNVFDVKLIERETTKNNAEI